MGQNKRQGLESRGERRVLVVLRYIGMVRMQAFEGELSWVSIVHIPVSLDELLVKDKANRASLRITADARP